MKTLKTLQEAIIHFADFDHCREFMIELRWPDGAVKCPRCNSAKVTWLAKARVWKCYAKHQSPTFTLKTGTVFEDSAISLERWLPAVWLVVNCKNGISSYEIARDLGVSQKSAWHMAHRIRFALHQGSFEKKLSGHIEVDETFIGGKARNMHVAKRQRRITGRGTVDKVAVQGILKRGGEVRTMVVDDRRKPTLQGNINEHVRAGAALYTDELLSYEGLASKYAHKVIDHAVSYVEGNVHTNGMENYWSLLKRGISGTYVSVEPFHLFRYLDEQSFRYNNRENKDGEKLGDFDRFKLAMSQIVGKRLTWDECTGSDEWKVSTN